MRVNVTDKCQGHNRCYVLAPGLFKVDEYGYASPRTEGGIVPKELEEKARLAMINCPEKAIELFDDDGTPITA